MLEQLATLIEQVMLWLGYVGIALIMFIENVFPPIPSEVVMPLAGFLAGEGKFEFFSVWIAGTFGSVLGAVVLYYIGLWVNQAVLLRFIERYGRWIGISVQDIHRALSVFDRYGEIIVFVGRLIPLIRSLISIPAGMHRMHFARFLAFTVGGSAIWSGVLAYAGMMLGQNWQLVVEFLKTYQNLTLATLGVGFIAFAAVFVVRRVRPALMRAQREARSIPIADK